MGLTVNICIQDLNCLHHLSKQKTLRDCQYAITVPKLVIKHHPVTRYPKRKEKQPKGKKKQGTVPLVMSSQQVKMMISMLNVYA
ncbi:unnamed protein product, partial [Iphiclides podalirius]